MDKWNFPLYSLGHTQVWHYHIWQGKGTADLLMPLGDLFVFLSFLLLFLPFFLLFSRFFPLLCFHLQNCSDQEAINSATHEKEKRKDSAEDE